MAAERDTRPDLVLFMTDQQRADQVGYASGGHFETPHLDALAARGTIFDTAYSAATTCVPARIALMTGLQPHAVRHDRTVPSLPEGHWTLPHALAAAGYETALVGKMHFDPVRADHGFGTMRTLEHLTPEDLAAGDPAHIDDYHHWLAARGVADWRAGPYPSVFPHDESLHPTGWVRDEALALLDRRDRTRPLFLVVSFPHPHAPLNPVRPWAGRYDPADAVLPTDGFEVNDGLPPAFQHALAESDGAFRPVRVPDESTLRNALTAVRSLVAHIDDAMGAVLARLDPDRTVIGFTSDHGDFAGHRGLMRKVPWIPFDDLARVPLVLAAPDSLPGRRTTDPVQSYDFALTCLDYAGVDHPADQFPSRSLRPWLRGTPPADAAARDLFVSTNNGWPTIRRGSLKLIGRAQPDRQATALFDLAEDPGETHDLSREPAWADVERELREAGVRQLWCGYPELPTFHRSRAPLADAR